MATAVEGVLDLRGQSERVLRRLARSAVPMVIVDGDRRHVEVNGPARLLFRLTLAELRQRRIDDLTPPQLLEPTADAWTAMLATGRGAGRSEVAGPDGGRLAIVYRAAADALPGLHVIALAPSGWSDEELGGHDAGAPAPLTLRELEILELAAEGLSGPSIAERLVVSPATIRTHFANIYGKLGVGDRAAAVARAMRMGAIG